MSVFSVCVWSYQSKNTVRRNESSAGECEEQQEGGGDSDQKFDTLRVKVWVCLSAKHRWCKSRVRACVWQWSGTTKGWRWQPVPPIKQLEHEVKRIVFNFHLTRRTSRLSQELVLMTANLRTKERMIYYCRSSLAMHIVNTKITIAEDHVRWLERWN